MQARSRRVVPTHVGVYRAYRARTPRIRRCPHARGGVPTAVGGSDSDPALSPRTWGCTGVTISVSLCHVVVPTHVGVYRPLLGHALVRTGCPHARGGVPSSTRRASYAATLSPRTWGCTEGHGHHELPAQVVPTHVGVYRRILPRLGRTRGCPHARGGVPERGSSGSGRHVLSPRTWGCTPLRPLLAASLFVVPTHVGVYRRSRLSCTDRNRCPHARGGVPPRLAWPCRALPLSPRTWGCTVEPLTAQAIGDVVPTHVGVYRTLRLEERIAEGCPHARGGVPQKPHCTIGARVVVPTHVGVYRCQPRSVAGGCVVPTHVGVYRRGGCSSRRPGGCPHARGGVPLMLEYADTIAGLSPRTWGCTVASWRQRDVVCVVPTHVGVYRG